MVFIIFQFLQAPVRMRGREIHLTGLPLGCALSPILSNLYLQSVDEAMQTANGVYLRYADDILLIASDQTSLNGMMENLTRALEARRLRLKQEKTQRFEFDGTPFAWLGHFLARNGIYDRISEKRLERIEARSKDAAAEAEKIATPSDSSASAEAAAGSTNATARCTSPATEFTYRCATATSSAARETMCCGAWLYTRVNRVVYMATGSFSSGFFASCINRRIPIVYYSGKGKGYAILIPEGNINALRLRAQFDLRSDPVRRLAVARSILQSKCDAMIHRIGSSPHFKDSVEKIRNYRERMNEASHIRAWWVWKERHLKSIFAFLQAHS
jgi:tRNA(Arg) A34 adenosine deaminase TadA